MSFNVAVLNRDLAMIKMLLQSGKVDIHAHNDWALRTAAGKGYLEVVECLLEHKADVHADNDFALEFAAYTGQIQVVQCLLEHGATYNPEWPNMTENIRQCCEEFGLGPKSAHKLK